MTLRRIDAETLLMPPAPPRDTVIMFFLASSMPLRMACLEVSESVVLRVLWNVVT